MSSAYIPKELRERVATQARGRCGYCLTLEWIIGRAMEFEHIIPEAAGGLTVESNLWLACSMCNIHKGDRTKAIDPLTHRMVRLFNPRRQNWYEHFKWSADGTQIEGLTPIGRATVEALQLNRPRLVQARQYWVQAGWHPPKD